MRFPTSLSCAVVVILSSLSQGANLPSVKISDWQPLAAQVRRLTDALEQAGEPLTPEERAALLVATTAADAEAVQKILDQRCLLGVQINPEMRVKAQAGPSRAELMETGWRVFLVKVANESGTTAELRVRSPNAERVPSAPPAEVAERWLEIAMFSKQPLQPQLSGLPLEYRVIQLYSRDPGKREARLTFDVGQGTQDLGFRSDVDILFDCRPAHEVALRVQDEKGQPTTASFIIRDALQRVYPSTAKRLAPDFAFHPQIYRADGEHIRLPAGNYTVEFSRGPESIPELKTVTINADTRALEFKVKRWIDPSTMGWWSGDHHIHAAGCAHYSSPTEGVLASDMMRHVLGEDLKVGCNLTWGPCFDYQKQFFTGTDDRVSQFPYLLRYDIEVSGFGSHESGHLCLLRLRDQIYPGGNSKDHWPKLCLNTLRWAKKQGAICGPAHTGWGLDIATQELPNYEMPKFNGIGANEYIVDITHEVPGPTGAPVPAVDFLSMVDTPYVWELNIWYHTLNAGFRPRISGETDFPCIYGERVGLGRSYVHLEDKLTYDAWCEGIQTGKNYVSDGYSHLFDFRVNDTEMGKNGSELQLKQPGKVTVSARVAARLDETGDPSIKSRPYAAKPFWHIERARVEGTREVPVEVIVNGFPVARTEIVADGHIEDVKFEIDLPRSSWVALRILPSAHTNPIFVTVAGKPIREAKSIEWCLNGVDQCWSQKQRFIQGPEQAEAVQAYDHAREVYRQRLTEAKAL